MSDDLTPRDVIAEVLSRVFGDSATRLPADRLTWRADADAVLSALDAAGYDVIPRQALLDLAQRWENDRGGPGYDCEYERHPEECAAELRALTRQETP